MGRKPIDDAAMVTTAFRLPQHLVDAIDKLGLTVRRNRSEIVRFAIEEYLNTRGKLNVKAKPSKD
jgi:metal-responsive CopG/Arc/MetJ family transcriptional regulator